MRVDHDIAGLTVRLVVLTMPEPIHYDPDISTPKTFI
jgi:hypothetical protein